MTLEATARDAGLRVMRALVDGFGPYLPEGIIVHHTAGADDGDMPSLRTLQNGVPGVEGPLTQLGLGRSGKVYVVCEEKARHAGKGSSAVLDRVRQDGPPGDHGGLNDRDGNPYFIGIECENNGKGQPWPEVQYAALVTLCAAICKDKGWTALRVIGHKEWTDRKIDPRGIDMRTLRANVAREMTGGDMPLTDADKDWIDARIAKSDAYVDGRIKQAAGDIISAIGWGRNGPYLPDEFADEAAANNIRKVLAAGGGGTPYTLAEIAEAVADENARRAQA